MLSARMGEIAVSASGDEELVALGLGSCIGLAMVDSVAQVAGLVHVVLPDSAGSGDEPGKYADLAVPELLSQVIAAGAVKRRLVVAVAGGAQMFNTGGKMEIGVRNAGAVNDALTRAGLRATAADTGGNQGRTVRVAVGSGAVTSRVAGGETITLLPGRPAVDNGRRASAVPALQGKVR